MTITLFNGKQYIFPKGMKLEFDEFGQAVIMYENKEVIITSNQIKLIEVEN